MRRTAAATAASLFAALAIGGPLAGTGAGASTTLSCAVASPPAACAHLDDLAAQLKPIAPILGTDLASLVTPAQGFAARSDAPGGVPTAEVVQVSSGLLDGLAALPDPVEALLGAVVLDELTGTLEALVHELSAPVTGEQQPAGASKPTPAKTAPAASSSAGPRSSDTSSFGGSASTSGSGGTTSSAAVPDVPVGDPLLLAPLALPDFGFSPTFEPVEVADLAPAVDEAEVALAEAADALSDQGSGAELAVVVVLSLLLIAGAGVAHLQAQRHTIPG
jgi:hypothetical protein